MNNNIYNILNAFNSVSNADIPAETTDKPTVYETVEPRGSITEAVNSLEEKYNSFNETAKPDFLDVDGDGDKTEPFKKAVKDKKADGEDKSADKGMSAKQAKYFGKKEVSEGAGPYTLDDPKHPKFEANYEKYKKAHPDCKLADFVAAMRKKEQGISEGMDDLTDLDAYQFAEPDKDSAVKPASAKQTAADRRRRLQDLEDRRAEKSDSYSDTKSNVRNVAGKAYGGSAQKDGSELDEATTATGGEVTKVGNVTTHKGKKYGGEEEYPNHSGNTKDIMDRKNRHRIVDLGDPEDYELDEVAPPGAKAERMVKGIKKGYSQDGNLSKKEKGIAYATAYKAKKAGNLDEATKFGDKIANSKAELKKAKPAMVKESRVMEETDYFYEKIGKALCSKNPNLDTSTGDFASAVSKEMVAQGMEPNRARGILLLDEDFLDDVATSYVYYCKEMHMEASAPANSHLGGAEELDEYTDTMTQAHIPSPSSSQPVTKDPLDEIARLAGILVKESDFMENSDEEEMVTFNDEEELAEDDVAEGNEFSGALAAAKAAGEEEFEVDGKRYTVKEDINVSITANGEEDALNLFRKLAGMDEVAAEPSITAIAVPQDMESALVQGIIEPVEEEREPEYSNTPNEKIAPISASIPSGDDLHNAKKSYSDRPYRGDNPMAVKEATDDSLWKKYSSMLKNMISK